ncbi:MAG: ribonuclease E/G, partial [Pseudomonadota bacterium]
MLIDATHPEETRVVVVDGQKVDDFDFESVNKKQLAGNIYLAKITRVEPSLQAAFVDYGGNRHGFLAFAEIHPDYYQIPVADREALIAEEAAMAREAADGEDGDGARPRRSRRRGSDRNRGAAKHATPSEADSDNAVPQDTGIAGFDVIELDQGADDEAAMAEEIDGAPPVQDAADATQSEVAAEADDETAAPTVDGAEGSDGPSEDAASEKRDAAGSPDTDSTPGPAAADGDDSVADVVEAAEEPEADQAPPTALDATAEAGPIDEDTAPSDDDAEAPQTPPRSMAESAGLGDDDDVVRGEVPDADATRSKTDAPAAEAAGSQSAVTTGEVPKDETPSVDTPAAEGTADGAPASEGPVDAAPAHAESAEAEAEAAPKKKRRSRRRTGAAEGADDGASASSSEQQSTAAPAGDDDGAADPKPPTTEPTDAEQADADADAGEVTAGEDEPKTRSRRSRRGGRGRSKATASAAADDDDQQPTTEAVGDADDSPADGDGSETTADGDDGREDTARRGRRRGRKRRRGDDGAAGDDGGAAGDGADDEIEGEGEAASEVDTVGAEDMREDELAARAIRRRRYNIQDVIKSRQIMLVQVVKEERGNKGAALTTYLSLAGRYCVLMPNTARGGGISRKITNASDRKRLREIVGELEVPEGMGLIVRTAGAERTRAEIKRDYEFLLRQWEQVRSLTLRSTAPCLIYEEGSLIKRAIRDLYNKDIDQVL